MTLRNKLKIFISIIAFIIFIVIINMIGDSLNKSEEKMINNYYENFDLEIQGVICKIHEQRFPYKSIVTLEVLYSSRKFELSDNFKYPFVMLNQQTAVFVDHYKYFELGDTIYIGYGENLIKCISSTGKLKMIKLLSQGTLYTVSPAKDTMERLLFEGCDF